MRAAGGGGDTVNAIPKVAALQASYVLLNRDACLDKALTLIAQAARQGARIVVLPVAFIPGTPIWIDSRPIWDGDEQWYRMLVEQAVVVPSAGRLSGLTCWENYMPLARIYLYAQGVDIWAAPTLARGDDWVATMRHIAREGRCYVIGVNPCLHADQIPADLPDRERVSPDAQRKDDGWEPWLA